VLNQKKVLSRLIGPPKPAPGTYHAVSGLVFFCRQEASQPPGFSSAFVAK
jgi:hypothetical protein